MKNNKAQISIFLDLTKAHNKKEFIQDILKEIPNNRTIGYAGYKEKKWLYNFVLWNIYREKPVIKKHMCLSEKKILQAIQQTLQKCSEVIGRKKQYIFVFPTFNPFITKKLEGVGGYSNWKNTIILTISPDCKSVTPIQHTLAHELAHALMHNYHERNTVGDDLVFEGIAEHLREHIIKGKRAVYTKALTKKQARTYFRSLEKNLHKKDEKFRSEIFFGNKQYPLWTGYAIGYYLVKKYLSTLDTIDWNTILQTKPEEILSKSEF